jgi:CHASE3 domain sensor protein
MFLKNFKIGQKMFLGFGIVTLLMLVVLLYSYSNFSKLSVAVDTNIHTYNVIRESDSILLSLVNMETGARGFAITGKRQFLEPFNQCKLDYVQHYNNIKNLTTDNPIQQDR